MKSKVLREQLLLFWCTVTYGRRMVIQPHHMESALRNFPRGTVLNKSHDTNAKYLRKERSVTIYHMAPRKRPYGRKIGDWTGSKSGCLASCETFNFLIEQILALKITTEYKYRSARGLHDFRPFNCVVCSNPCTLFCVFCLESLAQSSMGILLENYHWRWVC